MDPITLNSQNVMEVKVRRRPYSPLLPLFHSSYERREQDTINMAAGQGAPPRIVGTLIQHVKVWKITLQKLNFCIVKWRTFLHQAVVLLSVELF